MGDKSPEAAKKQASQRQAKSDSADQKKKQVIAAKQVWGNKQVTAARCAGRGGDGPGLSHSDRPRRGPDDVGGVGPPVANSASCRANRGEPAARRGTCKAGHIRRR